MSTSDKNPVNNSLATTNNLNIDTGVDVEKVFIVQGVAFGDTKRKDMAQLMMVPDIKSPIEL